MELLIDSDIVAYRAAASAENEEEYIAVARTHDTMHNIMGMFVVERQRGFLTGKDNFRRAIYPEYKANRTAPKPKHLAACREALILDYSASVVDGIEADDALGIAAHDQSIIVSIDKDLRQIPGTHYNFVKGITDVVDGYTASFNFYRQFLIGDRADNISGVKGIGEKKAEKELYGLTEEEMFDRCRELYQDERRFLLNGQLLHIWRKPDDLWKPEQLREYWDVSEQV